MNFDAHLNQNETVLSTAKSVYRRDEVVLRPAEPWTPSVHALLRHLESAGFTAAPRVVGTGFAPDGREMLSYVEGELVHPYAWSDEALVGVGRMTRALHEVTASFVPGAGAVWKPWFLRGLGRPERVIGHGDLAPWNMLTKDGLPTALIDWEFAGPVDPLVELARVCWLFAQLHDEDVAKRWGLPSAEKRAEQVRIIADAYGLSAGERCLLLDNIIEVVVCETAEQAVGEGITPERVGPLWGLAWRARSAAWILRHRRVLEGALE